MRIQAFYANNLNTCNTDARLSIVRLRQRYANIFWNLLAWHFDRLIYTFFVRPAAVATMVAMMVVGVVVGDAVASMPAIMRGWVRVYVAHVA